MDAGLGDNNPPTDQDAFLFELRSRHAPLLRRRTELLDAAERAPATIADADSAGQAADFIKQLTAHEKLANRTRADEKAPYLERGRWVDGFFRNAALAGIGDVKKAIANRLTAYQRREAERERRRREEEERREREEAERARQEAEAKAAAAETEEELDAAVAAEEDAAAAQERAEQAERATQTGAADLSRQHTAAGTVASLRTTVKCTAFSRGALDLEALRPYLSVDSIEKAIRAYIRAGGRELRGATIEEVSESRVA